MRPQPLRSFEVHTVATDVPYVAPKVPQLPPNTFLNILKAPEAGTPTVILYDALNTPLDAQAYGHEEMLKFLKHRRPGTQIAVFVLGSKLHLLQGFTEDTDLLTAALASKKGSPHTTTLPRTNALRWRHSDLGRSRRDQRRRCHLGCEHATSQWRPGIRRSA